MLTRWAFTGRTFMTLLRARQENIFQGAVSIAMAFVRDRYDPAYGEHERSARHTLRSRGLSRGPTEVYELRRDEALTLALVTHAMPSLAVFRMAQGADQAVAVK